MEVNVLGTQYTVERRKRAEGPKLEGCDGYCDPSVKRIVVEAFGDDPNNKADMDQYGKEVLRHEIVHAFLSESGLRGCTHSCDRGWAHNEEMVDWFALQAPKMMAAFQKAGCI